MPAIDCHVHFGPMPFLAHRQGLDDLERLLRQFAVERACVCSSLAAAGDLAAGNSELADAIEGRPFFLGLVMINANFPDQSLEEMRKHLSSSDFRGVKLDLTHQTQRLTSGSVQELVKALLRFDKPLLVHLRGIQDLEGLAETAAAFPSEKIVVADMGGSAWPEFIELASELTNLVLACGGGTADRDKIKEAIDIIGPRRVIFGSGCPLVHPAFALGMVRDSDISAPMKDRVLYRNASEIFKI
jgi:predicted TIM-barrel fold metal-dependent hydrolase